MLGNFRLSKSLKSFSDRKLNNPQQLSGILGLTSTVVSVPNREGFVYVRLQNNENEVITAFNDSVTPVYGLPVIVEWSVTRYVVIGRDIERYALWGTSSPYLPLHGGTHSFSDWGQGGDVVWVYSRQFMNLLAVPSGSSAGQNAVVYPYIYSYDEQWKYLSITGTPSLVESLPTGGLNAKMGLLYLDRRNNILGIDFSGDEFLASSTGNFTILQYLPQPASIHYLPIAGVRVVTGTSTIGWQNLYDVRPFFGGGGGGGGSLVGFTNGSVIFAESEQAAEDNDNFFYDNANNALLLGNNSSTLVDSTTVIRMLRESSLGQSIAAVGSSALAYFGLHRARGTIDSPTAVQSGDVLGRYYFNGHDGTGWQSKARWDGKATENWSATNRGTEIEVRTTPIAGTDTQKVGSWKGHGLELVKALQTGQLVEITNTYNTDEEDCIILMSWSGASGTSVDITLHHPIYESQILYIKRLDNPDYSQVNIDAGDGDNIDGESVIYLSAQYESVILVADGVDTWEVFSSSVDIANPNTITENTTNSVAGGTHTHALSIDDLVVETINVNGVADNVRGTFWQKAGQVEDILKVYAFDKGNIPSGFGRYGELFLGAFSSQFLVAATSINADLSYKKIYSAANVTLTSNPQISIGNNDGQMVVLQNIGSYTITMVNGNGIDISSEFISLLPNDWILLIWDDDNSLWSELSRSAKRYEQTWAFRSIISGSVYGLGHYKFESPSDDFSPAKTFGGADTAYGAKVFIVLGQVTVDQLTLEVRGTQIQPSGQAVTNQTENIVIPSGAAINTYYETNSYWTGQIQISILGGSARFCNYGFVRAWNEFDSGFVLDGLYASWLAGATDTEPDLLLRKHQNTGWTFVSGSSAIPPTEICSFATDYADDKDLESGGQGTWQRSNLSTYISGSYQGLIFEVKASVPDAFAIGNLTLRYRNR